MLFYVHEETIVILLNRGEKLMESGFRKFSLEMASKLNKERKELVLERGE